jgi:predicted ATPase/DNA-binding SARP family transcriptional activator
MPSNLELAFLGNITIRRDGLPMTGLKSLKAQALLCYLAVTGRPHYRPALAGLLWGGMPEAKARMNLSQALSILRRSLGDHLSITRQTVSFNWDSAYALDTETFEANVGSVSARVPVKRLEDAIELYRGDFLDGFYVRGVPEFEVWVLGQRARLRELALQALHRLIDHYTGLGEDGWATAIDYTAHLLALEPWREEAHRQMMYLLALSGQRGAALAQFEKCRQVLGEELSVEPVEDTTELYEQIRDGHLPAEVIQRFSLPAPTPIPRHNLPAQTTPLIGREVELAALDRLLTDPGIRLVTILGPGGIGKSHLALEAASAQLERSTREVYLVQLAPLESPDQIVDAIAETIDLSFSTGRNPQEQLLDHLRQKPLLLVLDNFEHLLSATHTGERRGPGLVVDMLRAAPDLRILATSRERLNVRGEQLVSIAGLELPLEVASPESALKCGAVQLFVQSARRARTGFRLTDSNLHHIVQICRLVDGMPLGILLAAAWVEVLAPSEIEQEIVRSLDFLETEFQDAPRRHRSMRGVFDHSWMLLTEDEQRIFQALSVFRGGFTRQAAREVAGSSVKALRSFAHKSLLSRTSSGRYDIHQLLRQYAAEKLSQSPAGNTETRDAHSAYYCGYLHQRERELKGARRLAALAEITTERENARAAWNWAVAHGQTERLGQAMESLASYYQWRGRFREGEEALRLMAESIAAPKRAGQQRLLARALTWQANFNRELGRTELATQLARQGLKLLDSPLLCEGETCLERADALYCLGFATLRHDYDHARRLWQQSLELYRAGEDQWGMADALGHLGMIAWELGRYDEAKRQIEEALVVCRALGNQEGMGDVYSTLGWIALTQGQLDQAEKLAQECTARYRQVGDQARIAKGLRDLAAPKLYLGKFDEASSLLEESIALFDELGGSGDLVFANILLAATECQLGQYPRARRQAQTGLDLARRFEDRAGVGRALLWLGRVALAEGAGAEAQGLFRESAAIFRELGIRDQLSSALASLGHSARALGNPTEARPCLYDALQTAIEIGAFLPLLFAIPLAALLKVDCGEKERAVELYAQATRYSFVANSRWCQDLFGRHIDKVAATLPPDAVAAAQMRGHSQDLWAAARSAIGQDGILMAQ